MNTKEKLATATRGLDLAPEGYNIATAGINLEDHGNAIEIYAETLPEAQMLRDEILSRMLCIDRE